MMGCSLENCYQFREGAHEELSTILSNIDVLHVFECIQILIV